ncbi:MAG: ribonuclease J [Bacteriovoracaceae bacterium]
MSQNHFNFTPLGGLGRIGANMNLIEMGETRILLDCGILFPDDNPFNIEYIIPDYSNINKPTDLVLTHAHEDHLGGLKLLLKRFPDIKIHAPLFAKTLIERKGIKKEIREYKNKQKINFGDFHLTPLKVDHSIPDTYGVFIEANDFCLFYLSDFKINENNSEFDLKWLEEQSSAYSKKILLTDSTNIISKNLKTQEEDELYNPLSSYFKKKGRLFITFFASNSFRLRTILKLAKENKRTVVTYGASMANYFEVAKKTGFLDHTSSGTYDVDEVDPKDKSLVVLVSGCQGDFKSAVKRVAYGEDKYFRLDKNDTFLFSSKTIPGNEVKISNVLNKITESEAEIVTSDDDFVHVSGHAGKKDLQILYNHFKPTHFVPIHGESYFLKRHLQFFLESFSNAKTHLLFNFNRLNCDMWTVDKNEAKDPVLVQTKDIEISKDKIKERRKIAQGGLVLVSLDTKKRKFKITCKGLPDVVEEKKIFSVIDKYLKKSQYFNMEELRILIRKSISRITGIKPEVYIHDL